MRHIIPKGRRLIAVAVNVGLILAANTLAFWLRFDGAPAPAFANLWIETLPWLVVIRGTMFVPFRLYEGLWRYTGISDLRDIGLGVLSSSLAFWLLETLSRVQYPRSIILVDSLVLIFLMSAARLGRRAYHGPLPGHGHKRVLVYGAGDAGAQIVRTMLDDPDQSYRPVGFVDDNPGKVGRRIHGVRVLGTGHDIQRVVATCRPDEVLIAIPRADTAAIRSVIKTLEPCRVPIKTLPNLREIIEGRIGVAQIRGLALEDLLERAPVGLDRRPLKHLIAGRRVMVTGAGGSIGSELCRQIADLKPATLVMLDRYENTLHAIRLELDEKKHAFGIIPVIGDVTDVSRVNAVLAEYQPEIIFHAAAHKHVPLMEENPCEAVKNNVRGTRVLAQSADAFGVDHFIMISTDKAVNPTSVMGASKRVAELVIQAQAVGSGTTFSIVRFGNVLGSNGSVVPHFVDQIRKGGPVTITHPDIRRFFMLIPEAVQLVLHAAAQAENGATYVLEMGEQVKLLDMARNLIRLSGFTPDEEIKIEFIGLRPGEKLYEELVGAGEDASPSSIEKILCVRSRGRVAPDLFARVQALEAEAVMGRTASVLAGIKELIGTFQDADVPPHPVPPPPGTYVFGHDEQRCPACGSPHARRSRARTMPERLKKEMTTNRMFRCEDCNWRGWLAPLPAHGVVATVEVPPPDLASLDSQAKLHPVERRQSFAPRNLP
jgi:FlaA1/EpsC-like NDP-sugar epimerase